MSDEFVVAERKNDIERDLLRFYERNPSLAAKKDQPVEPPRNPMDVGTVGLPEMEKAVARPSFRDMNFPDEVLPLLRKRLVWDLVPEAADIARWSNDLAVTPGSPEGNVVEKAESDARRARLLPLMPLVRIAGWTAGEIVSRATMLDSGDYEPGGNARVIGSEHDVTQEVTAGAMAVIANLLEMDILTYGKAVTGG